MIATLVVLLIVVVSLLSGTLRDNWRLKENITAATDNMNQADELTHMSYWVLTSKKDPSYSNDAEYVIETPKDYIPWCQHSFPVTAFEASYTGKPRDWKVGDKIRFLFCNDVGTFNSNFIMTHHSDHWIVPIDSLEIRLIE